jgi:hypothetical protein
VVNLVVDGEEVDRKPWVKAGQRNCFKVQTMDIRLLSPTDMTTADPKGRILDAFQVLFFAIHVAAFRFWHFPRS